MRRARACVCEIHIAYIRRPIFTVAAVLVIIITIIIAIFIIIHYGVRICLEF
jgi:hypothetical protein